jgi:hypothetical protein
MEFIQFLVFVTLWLEIVPSTHSTVCCAALKASLNVMVKRKKSMPFTGSEPWPRPRKPGTTVTELHSA